MIEHTSATVRVEQVENIALIIIDNPPVNASSQSVREGLNKAIDLISEMTGIDAIAVYGDGRTFIAGADIREFGKTSLDPPLPDVCQRLENSEIPVVAIIHGTALGGGFEVALACHARVAVPSAKVGLPEVLLGVLPGAGGTQRTPRLIGIDAALEMITTGRHIPAAEALDLGLIDRVMEGEPRDIAIKACQAIASGSLPTRRTGALTTPADEDALNRYRAKLEKTQGHLFSPHKCVDAVAASTGNLREGLEKERSLFFECLESPQRAGLIHAFFAERAVTHIPEKTATARNIVKVGVLGAGTMGSGIATAALLSGYSVTLIERDADALARGRSTVEKNLAAGVKRGKLTEAKKTDLLQGALTTSIAMADFADMDLVIEAVFEDMSVKHDVFRQLDDICKPGAVLATNTSYLDINEIAAVTTRPEDVIGLHFFSPAHIMRLLEVVVADKTAPEIVATGFQFAKKLRKVGVRAGVCDGFIGNRIMAHYRKTVDYLMLDGAPPSQIDRALTNFGLAMGPCAVSDLAGLDIAWAARKRQAATRPPEERYVKIADRICEAGWFGRKTGRGFYLYADGAKPEPNPDVLAIIDDERQLNGISPRDFGEDEIIARFTTAMISEAVRVLEDGIALRPIDIDAVFLFGYGFPRFRGGPLQYADMIGAAELVSRIERYAAEDAYYWQVPALLRDMAETGKSFAALNENA